MDRRSPDRNELSRFPRSEPQASGEGGAEGALQVARSEPQASGEVTRTVGLDFGTTHSAIAVWDGSGAPRLATFASGAQRTAAYRSILHFEPDPDDERRAPRVRAGPDAIERYLETAGDGRLVQSIKSFLASPLFERTEIFGAIYELEDLVGRLVAELRAAAEVELGPLGASVVVGRPVKFAGDAKHLDERLALSRLRSALARAGFHDVRFELEPVAAAHHYGLRIERPERVLIGDFGGGTSDFSVLEIAPGGGRPEAAVLGTSGVGVAGDAFDAKLVRQRVAPALGRGTRYRNVFGEVLPVPAWLYTHLERWHHLSFLKSSKTLALLGDLEREALEPERLRAFGRLVREDRGFHVYRAIETAKHELSRATESRVRYRDAGFALDTAVARGEFEDWIAAELAKIERCVDESLAQAQLDAAAIDRVFLTGGSALVPAVRRIFETRFGAERIRGGEELTSVASGLALRAAA